MAISTPQVSVDAALSAVNSIATASATQLDAMAAQANTRLFQAATNMGWSNSIVASINNPDFQSSIRNSIQGLQNDIQNTINNASTTVNQNIRAAQIANGISNIATGAAVVSTAVVTYDAAQSGNAQNLGGAVIGSLVGTLAGGLATALTASATGVLLPLAAGVAAAITAAIVVEHFMPDSWKEAVGEFYQDMRDGFADFLTWWDPLGIMPDGINDDFNNSKNWTPPRRDPLAIDLDGDGIETIGADGTVVFDHNGNGVKTGTGWVSADDGFLVLDQNNNGTIDTGAELFGVDTVKSDGSLATDGFDALSDLDSNNDGVFDAQDTEFANVQIWQDLDQDGISDSGELSSLTDAGIVGIDLNAEDNNVNLGNGNVQTASSAHLTVEGEEGETGNLDLASNPFYSEFTNAIPLTEAALALPESRGSGMVRDLREAMSLSSDLTSIVSNYADQTSYSDQRAELDNLVTAWSETSTMQTSIELAEEQNFNLIYMIPGQSVSDFNETGSVSGGSGGGSGGSTTFTDPDELEAQQAEQQAPMAQQAYIIQMIEVLEKFNGDQFVTVETDSVTTGAGQTVTASAEGGGGGGVVTNPDAPRRAFLMLSQQQIDLLTQSYEQLKESIYGNLVTQTRLTDYTDEVQLAISETLEISLDFSEMNTLLETRYTESPANALADLIELARYSGASFYSNGWNGFDLLQTWVSDGAGDPAIETVLTDLNVSSLNENVTGTNESQIIIDGDNASSLSAMGGNDVVLAGAGNDYVFGQGGNDVLDGGEGRDVVYGGAGDDTLRGGTSTGDTLSGDAGNDVYLFGLGDGDTTISNYETTQNSQDTLNFLEGVNPENVQVTRSSTNLVLTIQSTGEVITVSNYFYNDADDTYALDEITFTDGTVWNVDTIKTLVQQGSDTADTLYGYATEDTLNGQAGNDYIYGAAGNDTLDAGDGNDWVFGQNDDDTITGGAGNDYVYGDAGNDTLDGGDGRDVVYGGTGDDTLRGGAGTGDTLSGDAGNDVYLFGNGDGNTTISNYDAGADRQDTLRFLEGISSDDVRVTRSSTSLVLTVQSTGEAVTISSFFSGSIYELNQVEFNDGTTWSADDLKVLALGATDGADNITGYDGSDTINSLGGNDYLYGANGDDNLDGGDGNDWIFGQNDNDTVTGGAGNDYVYGNAGNDTLNGGDGRDVVYGGAGDDTLRGGTGIGDTLSGDAGNDVYLFGSGDGNTTISNYDAGTDRQDTLRFLEGISSDDVRVTRSSTSLVLTVQSTGEVVTVSSFFSGSIYELNQVEFNDGTIWSAEDLKVLALGATDDADNITGYDGSDTINSLGGNDYLYGADGDDNLDGGDGNDWIFGQNDNDTVIGGAGNDYVYGDAGNDTLDGGDGRDVVYGGAGNDTFRGGTGTGDTLSGDAGNDVYLFGNGDGNTTVSNYDAGADRQDTLRFLEGIEENDVRVTRSSTSLVLTVQSTDETVTVSSFFSGSIYELNQVEFNDGTTWSANDLKAFALEATDGADNITGYDGSDIINSLGGNDYLYGAAGNDNLDGGDGNDWIFGQNDDDTVNGGAGNDYVYGDAGNDTLNGGDGHDVVYGGTGNDTLRGGAGANDTLSGDAGNDTYLFGLGDGNTTISNYDAAADRQDTLQFLDGITADDVRATRSSTSLVLTIQSTGETVTVSSFFSGSVYELNQVEFTDGTVWDADTLKLLVQEGSTGADNLYGYANADTLDGQEGNDYIYGGAGNDNLQGGDGNDWIFGQNDDDTVNGGAGNDYVYGDAGNDTLEGGDGRDVMYGGTGDDTLLGGAGNSDTLSGDGGNDTYVFDADFGTDTVSNYDPDANSVDIAQFDNVSIEELWFSRSGNNLHITVAGTDNQVTVSSWYSGDVYQLDNIQAGTSTLLNNQVDQLVNAMAAYDVPLGAGNVVPQDVQDELQTTLAETWQS